MTDTRLIDISGGRTASQRRSARAAERRRKSRRRRTWVSVLIGLAVIGGAVSIAYLAIRPVIASLTEPKDYPGPGSGQVVVTIDQGTITDTAKALQAAGVIKTVQSFTDLADPRAATIHPGVYQLKLQMTAAGALDVLANPANRQVTTVTLNEGLRLPQLPDKLAAGTKLPRADLEAASKNVTALGLPAQAKGQLEGWLFPATYEVTPKTTATGLLSQMVAQMVTELTTLGVPPAQWQRTVIEASLVQAESGSEADSPKIARVLENRIAAKRPLQLDTTVNYALNRYKVAVAEKDTRYPSPYNTYLHLGLPVGAICSPGEIALKAVLHPAPGPWMYFVAVNPDTGLTKYGVTVADFTALQNELNAWLKAHPGR